MTVWNFAFGEGRTVRARRYADEPACASLFFTPEGPVEGDRELNAIVAWLHNVGVSEILVLGRPAGAYRPLQQRP